MRPTRSHKQGRRAREAERRDPPWLKVDAERDPFAAEPDDTGFHRHWLGRLDYEAADHPSPAA
jgi:hypothetical protein